MVPLESIVRDRDNLAYITPCEEKRPQRRDAAGTQGERRLQKREPLVWIHIERRNI